MNLPLLQRVITGVIITSAALLACAPDASAEFDSSLALSLRHHSNVPNAADAGNRYGDNLVNVDYQINKRLVTGPGNVISIGLLGQSDVYQRSTGLNRLAAGTVLGYSHRFGLGPQAPRLRLSTSLVYEHYDGSVRRGMRHQSSAGVSRWMSDSVLLSGSWQWINRDGKHQQQLQANPLFDVDVFDQQRQELALRADYILPHGHAVSVTVGYADGDMDASARPGTALRQAARAIAHDNGIGRHYLAYRVKSHSKTAGVQWNRALSDSRSLSLGAERRLASAASGLRYQETRVHIDYLVSL